MPAYIPPTHISPAGEQFIMTDEHFEEVAYDIDGHPTLAWGHTGLKFDGTPVRVGDRVTRPDGIRYFNRDIQIPTRAVLEAAAHGGLLLLQNELDALVSLTFNCGVACLQPGHSLGNALAAGNRQAVADSILEYENATINGVHGPFLRKRRAAEYLTFIGPRKLPLSNRLDVEDWTPCQTPEQVADTPVTVAGSD